MRRVAIFAALAGLLSGCAQGVDIDWRGVGQGMTQSACRQSSRCDLPVCSASPGESAGREACDNPYPGGGARRTGAAAR
ncbi:hypothetical protein D3C80_1717600 [compost metagenome]